MSEEEKKAIEILKQEPDFSLSYYKREHAIDIVLNLIEKQQKEIEDLKKLLYQIRNELRYKVIIQEDGIYKPCKNLTKQEVYESFVKLNLMLKANYVFKNNEEAIEELLKEGEEK